MSRGNYKFNRCDAHEHYSSDRVNWLDEFANKLAKEPQTIVDVSRANSYSSIVDQINSVMTNKPVHATVESVVKDMQERIGLKEYLKVVSNDDGSLKTAQLNIDDNLKKRITDYVKYILNTHHGQISLPAIQYELKTSFDNEVSDDYLNSSEMINYLNSIILNYQSQNTIQEESNYITENMKSDLLSDNNESDDDFFKMLSPQT